MNEYRRVRLLATISGLYGNYEIGEVLRLPFEEAESLVRQGYAAYEGEMETASVQPSERAVTRARATLPTRRTI